MPSDLAAEISATAFAFRGYNITNLGRSAELLAHPRYGELVREQLTKFSRTTSEVVGRHVDLVARVTQNREPVLDEFDESVALIMAMEVAQMRLLETFHGISLSNARLAFGYSLGELAALAVAGTFEADEIVRIPLMMARDCAELAHEVHMGILFSRGLALPYEDVVRLCLHINEAGEGVIGISAILSPNTVLLLGQRDTVARFQQQMGERLRGRVHLRHNEHQWPPMHTPIMWQRHIPNRSAQLMHTLRGGYTAPKPPILSLVTGKTNYNDYNARDILNQWVDHPQRLWDAVYETLARGVRTVIHVGPQANLIPATFKRLSDNVAAQVNGRNLRRWGLWAMTGMVRRQWLAAILPSRTALLRAPYVRHVMLEDWLLENG